MVYLMPTWSLFAGPVKYAEFHYLLQALLTRIRLIKECVILSFTLRISILFGVLITMPA